MNNIDFDISFNSINQISPLPPIFDSDNFRTIFRPIFNLLNIPINNNTTNNFINNSLYLPKKKYKQILSAKGGKTIKNC